VLCPVESRGGERTDTYKPTYSLPRSATEKLSIPVYVKFPLAVTFARSMLLVSLFEGIKYRALHYMSIKNRPRIYQFKIQDYENRLKLFWL